MLTFKIICLGADLYVPLKAKRNQPFKIFFYRIIFTEQLDFLYKYVLIILVKNINFFMWN